MDTITQAESVLKLSHYITDLELEDLSPSTVAKYRQNLRDYLLFLAGDPISEHSAKLFLAHLRNRGFKPTTIELYYHGLKPFLLSQGINLKAKFKKRRKLPIYHNVNQVKAVLAAIGKRNDNWSKLAERDWLIIATLAYTGIRRGELLALRLSDIDQFNKTMRIHGKGDKERIIPISPILYERLASYLTNLQSHDYLFPLKSKRVNTIVTNYARKVGINDLHPHAFRHFFATQLVENGVSLHIIKELLGHADISTTAIYLDILPKHLESAVSALPDLRS